MSLSYSALQAKAAAHTATGADIASWLSGTNWDGKGTIDSPANQQVINQLQSFLNGDGSYLSHNVIIDSSTGITVYLGEPGQPPVEDFPLAGELSGGGGPIGSIVGGIAGADASAVQALDDVKKFLGFLLDPVRMGEIIVGVILIAAGVNHMLKSSGSSARITNPMHYQKAAHRVRGPANPMIAEGANKSALRKIAKTGIEVAK